MTTFQVLFTQLVSASSHFRFGHSITWNLLKRDLKQPEPQATVNALAHAKRALDCQLDYFLLTYGLLGISNKEKWSTGKKISLMRELLAVSDNILHRVNRARNDLEHRHQIPSRVTAENSIDIVSLFIMAADLYLFPASWITIFLAGEEEEPSDIH